MPALAVIDLHSHIVPGVDDGAGSISEATSMLARMESEYGVGSAVVFTPHFASGMPERVVEARRERALRFTGSVADGCGLDIFNGGELLLRGLTLDNIEAARYPGTGWVLVEFTAGSLWLEVLILLRRVIAAGYKPLIAHPERYRWCRSRKGRLAELSEMGCGVLVSARSLRSQKYAPAARSLLSSGLAHGLASDAHSIRDFILDERLRTMVETSSSIPWELLTLEMPGLVLEDEELPRLPLSGRELA